jgi:hypothetical protein
MKRVVMVDRRSLAIGVFAILVAASQAGYAQEGRGGGAPQGRGAGSGRGGGGGFGARGPAFTPEANAKDMKSVLFNWTWHMGMLRSGNESELVKTLDYYSESGTIQVDGQPCTLAKAAEPALGSYHVQVNYQVPGWRTQYECKRANGTTYKNVEVVSGDYAWDEDIPGAELVPGKGKATPKPATRDERLIRLWASPHGAPKAAIAGAVGLPVSDAFGQNPAVLFDRQAAAGAKPTTTMTWQGDKVVFTFPIPGVAGAVATATLDSGYLPERVVVKHGTNTTEFVYTDYQDWNNPLFKIEALYAGRIVERRNGTVVRDIKTKLTEIGQVYVIMPVPDSVQKAAGK